MANTTLKFEENGTTANEMNRGSTHANANRNIEVIQTDWTAALYVLLAGVIAYAIIW